MDAEKHKPTTVLLPEELIPAIDARLRDLDMNRSQYFRALIRKDLAAAAKPADSKQPALALAAGHGEKAA